MSMTSRPYADDADYAEMRRLLRAHAAADDRHYCTVGDLDWWNAQRGDAPGSVRAARLWFADSGELAGFIWPGRAEADCIAHPAHPAVVDAMLDWCEAVASASGPGTSPFTTHANDGDADRVARLGARGYRRQERALLYRRRSLDGALPEPTLPAGYAVRSFAGEEDLERRVAVHRAAFAPSRMTAEKHRAVMASPTYRPELDLFTVAPDGTFASYCLVWFDEANRIGVFEPVGTHPGQQRRGLGRAVLAEGLRRLRGLGAEKAFVGSNFDNVASNALYEAVGFRLVDAFHAWEKTLQ